MAVDPSNDPIKSGLPYHKICVVLRTLGRVGTAVGGTVKGGATIVPKYQMGRN